VMADDPRARLVEAFTADFARAVGAHGVGGVLGDPGRRAALLVDRVMRMHLPGTAGACPDCRATPGRSCATWAVVADVLAGWEPEQVEAEYRRLSVRYPPTVPVVSDAVSAANDRVHVMVRLAPDDPAPGPLGVLGARLTPDDRVLRLAREQVVYAGVQPTENPWPVLLILPPTARSLAVSGQRYTVREPARRRLSVPAERSSVTVAAEQVYDIADTTEDGGARGWVCLLMLPRDVTEFRVGEVPESGAPRERSFEVHRPSRGRPVG
jgi:hypothetical protein